MNEIGRRIGAPAATVSQVERAERALKEDKIPRWAEALGLSPAFLRKLWNKVQQDNPDPPLVRPRRKESVKAKTLEDRLNELTGNERQQVLGYMDAIVDQVSKEEPLHLHKLLDAMLSKADVWVPHWQLGWEPTKIVNITRAGSVTVTTNTRTTSPWTCKASDVHLEDPRDKEQQ